MTRKIDFEVVKPKPAVAVEVKTPGPMAAEVYLPGRPGPAGHTPMRGVDYFTPEDIDAMVDAVAARFEDGDKEAY